MDGDTPAANFSGPEPFITFTIRELLGDIKKDQLQGFAALNAKLDGKADKTDFVHLYGRVDQMFDRLEKLERWRGEREEAAKTHQQRDDRDERRRQWRMGLAMLVATVVIAMAALLPQIV